jgi:PKD repeat protein
MLAGSPTGSSFVDNGDNTGTFSWTPGFTQAGSYSVTFRGTDGNGGSAQATTAITVNNVDRAPIADAGGPYSGILNVPVQFDGSGSSDPDGDALSYMWDFGDGGSSTEVSPMHTYTATGIYNVTLTVMSGTPSQSDTDETTATITDELAARVFAIDPSKAINLKAGKPFQCWQIEPVDGSFNNSDVVLASIKMISNGTGTVSEIFADATKSGVDGDKDGNGVAEIQACFTKEDLRALFADAANGTYTVAVEGSLITGGKFHGTVDVIIKGVGKAAIMASLSNSLHAHPTLSFATTKPGALRVQMFDARGRLVKTIADETSANAGYHDYTIDGRSTSGSKLASGVYFVRITSQHDGDAVQRVTIMK